MTKLRHHTAQDDNVLRLCRNGGIVFYKLNVIQLLQQAFFQLFAVWFQRNGSPVVRAENGICFLCHGVVIGCDLIKQVAVRNDRIEREKRAKVYLAKCSEERVVGIVANDCVAIRDTLDGFVKSNLQGISDACELIGKSLDEEHRFGFVGRGVVVADIYRYDVGVAAAQTFCRKVDAVIIEIDKLPDFAFCVLAYARIVLVVKDVTHGSDRNACLFCDISHCDFLAHNNRIIQLKQKKINKK